MTPEEFADVLRLVESDANPNAWGDDGRAFTSYQSHIDWLFDHALRWNLRPALSETAESFVRRVVIRFAQEYLAVWLPEEVAMAYHEGHDIKPDGFGWDYAYQDRWNEKVAQLGFAATQVRIRNTSST